MTSETSMESPKFFLTNIAQCKAIFKVIVELEASKKFSFFLIKKKEEKKKEQEVATSLFLPIS